MSFKVKCVESKIKNEQNNWQFENVDNESQINKHDGRVYLGKHLLTKVKNKNIFCNLHVWFWKYITKKYTKEQYNHIPIIKIMIHSC